MLKKAEYSKSFEHEGPRVGELNVKVAMLDLKSIVNRDFYI